MGQSAAHRRYLKSGKARFQRLDPQQDAAAEIGINAAPGMTQAAGAIKVKAAVGGFPQTCGSCQQDRVKCFTQPRQQHGSRAFTMPAQTAQIIEKCAEGQFMHTFAVKFIQQRIQFSRFQLSMCKDDTKKYSGYFVQSII